MTVTNLINNFLASQKSKLDKLDKISQLVFGKEEEKRRQEHPDSNQDHKESKELMKSQKNKASC
jgi:hypothetical protein